MNNSTGKRGLFLGALSILISYVRGNVPIPECSVDGKNITCFHGSQCKTGEADFSMFPSAFFLEKRSEEGAYCDCSTIPASIPRHTGVSCNHKYEVCPDNHICFHGATCVAKNGNNTTEYSCDCSKTTRGTTEWEGEHCQIRKQAPPSTPTPKPECTLNCYDRGVCNFGTKKDFGLVVDPVIIIPNNVDGMYCECNDGFTGVQCETYVRSCGNSYCLNSAKCVVQGTSAMCDCTSIISDIPVAFSGEHCQYPDANSVKCLALNNETEPLGMFCVNGGQCDPEQGCKCTDDFTGHRCNYRKEKPKPPCDLKCANDGVCVDGIADFGFANDFELTQLEQKHIDFKHCQCKKGYTGVLCEIELNVCGDNEFVCAFGSKCVSQGKDFNGKDKYTCDCDAAHTVLTSFAGKMCEYASTSFCARRDEKVLGDSAHAFCTNGGTCVDIVTPYDAHPGCQCSAGFTGDHCEFKVETLKEAERSQQNEGGSRASATLMSLLTLSLFGAVVVLVYVTYYRKQEQESNAAMNGNNHSIQPSDSGASLEYEMEKNTSDNGDGEMKDIEII